MNVSGTRGFYTHPFELSRLFCGRTDDSRGSAEEFRTRAAASCDGAATRRVHAYSLRVHAVARCDHAGRSCALARVTRRFATVSCQRARDCCDYAETSRESAIPLRKPANRFCAVANPFCGLANPFRDAPAFQCKRQQSANLRPFFVPAMMRPRARRLKLSTRNLSCPRMRRDVRRLTTRERRDSDGRVAIISNATFPTYIFGRGRVAALRLTKRLHPKHESESRAFAPLKIIRKT